MSREIPGSKYVEVISDKGKPPVLRCKKHNRFLLTYVLREAGVERPVCMECLADTGVEIDRAVVGRGGNEGTRMIPRIPGTALVSTLHKKFICKWCTESFETFQDLTAHYEDCDIRSMGLRPPS